MYVALYVCSVASCIFPSIQEANTRLLKTGGISVRDKELVKGPWKPMSVEAQASLLYPVRQQCGGILVFGYETISYCSEKVQHAIDPPTFKVTMVTIISLLNQYCSFSCHHRSQIKSSTDLITCTKKISFPLDLYAYLYVYFVPLQVSKCSILVTCICY